MARIKGVALSGIVKALRSLRDEAEPRLPESVRYYLDERVIASQWYPEEDYRALVATLGELLCERVPGNVWEFLGERGATEQFNDVYNMVVRRNDPVGTLRRASTTWSLYHDTGRVNVAIDEPARRARIELHEYPMACDRLCGTTTGYLRQLLVQAGATAVQVVLAACPPVEEGPVVWEATWADPTPPRE